jgi:hypothetical protein|tara:strand:- start:2613 stop:4415 length:1803 start_codon:yes stop_codon:yes gene_type:complete
MAEQRDIKYVNKEFSDFRSQLVEHAKNYFPDTYNDFSATAPGMMFIEMASYVGDVLSFYQDTQLQETFLTHAKDPKNLFNLAYTMGYVPKVTGVSEVELTLTQQLAASSTYKPNWSAAASINSNATFRSTDSSQTFFLVDKPVDFNFSSSLDPTDVVITALDGSNRPTQYEVSKKVKAFSAEIQTKTFDISTAEKFKTLTIADDNIVGVLDVTDADGNIYYEVPFLGQDTIFKEDANSSSDSNLVSYVLGIRKVPRRFVSRFLSNGNLTLQFGSGTTSSDDSEILPDATTVGSATNQGVSRLDYSYDPSNFLFSKAYGIAPTSNLTVRYLKGGGVGANVPSNTITQVSTISGTNTGTVTVNNTQPAFGGRDGDTEDELRENSLRAFNEQSRTVTLQDYTVRSLALPSRFGSVAKAFATQDQLVNTNIDVSSIKDSNPLSIALYILAYNSEGKLTNASSTLKNNLKTYLSEYIMVTDSVTIKDAYIVNIGVEYEIIMRPNYISRDVLLACNIKLQEYFKTQKRNINQSINLADIFRELDKVKGVQTVQKVEIVNKQGGNYSQFAYDVKGATRDNVVYPSYDPCIFEVKYPNLDIKGRITTL